MKRTGNLFHSVFSIENLLLAYQDARRGKRKKRACFEFEKHLGENIQSLHQSLLDGTYTPAPYTKFMVQEPKPRLILAPAFADVVVQHAIYRIVYPLFDTTFISASFACRKGYGTHRASDYTQQAMRRCRPDDYFLQLDIRKFFYSIDRDQLRLFIERKIKDWHLVDVMMAFSYADTDRGIPIGNLLSQLYALIYLNPLDHFIKRILRIKRYVRYVDDFILLGLTKGECISHRLQIVDFLSQSLRLELSKTTIAQIKRGINFVGYRTWRALRIIRKYSLFKFKRKARAGKLPSVVSLLGHAKRTQSLNHMLSILQEQNHALFLLLPKSYRSIYDLRTAITAAG
jgi:retron-type reverse transcriptase